MPHNPILNVYMIELNPVDKEVSTFRHFCKSKFFTEDETPTDMEMFKSLFENFLKALGGNELITHQKSKKVLGIQQIEGFNESIKSHFDSTAIEGVIDGGKYGISRQVADIQNNKERQALSSQKAILDKYYFYLFTPLNSSRGIVLIQSYTEETVQLPFKDFLQRFFCHEDHFYQLKYDNCIPERIVKNFAEESEITMFKYKTIIGIGDTLRNDKDNKIDGFEVIMEIRPIPQDGKVTSDLKTINRISKDLQKKKFEKKSLGDMNSPTVFIKNNGNKMAHFDITKQIESIKPTVYLENEGVQVDEATGMPNFEQMKGVCEKILKEVVEEIVKKRQIDEF